ncbi:hypothetical protein GGR56DRAFT_150929 [Xylariaceae sp. FL0804]|nr:hypothetical protein GGR56DRAFT_150929 [Xylariaceae sp. FL0804]
MLAMDDNSGRQLIREGSTLHQEARHASSLPDPTLKPEPEPELEPQTRYPRISLRRAGKAPMTRYGRDESNTTTRDHQPSLSAPAEDLCGESIRDSISATGKIGKKTKDNDDDYNKDNYNVLDYDDDDDDNEVGYTSDQENRRAVQEGRGNANAHNSFISTVVEHRNEQTVDFSGFPPLSPTPPRATHVGRGKPMASPSSGIRRESVTRLFPITAITTHLPPFTAITTSGPGLMPVTSTWHASPGSRTLVLPPSRHMPAPPHTPPPSAGRLECDKEAHTSEDQQKLMLGLKRDEGRDGVSGLDDPGSMKSSPWPISAGVGLESDNDNGNHDHDENMSTRLACLRSLTHFYPDSHECASNLERPQPGQWYNEMNIFSFLRLLAALRPDLVHMDVLAAQSARQRDLEGAGALRQGTTAALLPVLVRDDHWVLGIAPGRRPDGRRGTTLDIYDSFRRPAHTHDALEKLNAIPLARCIFSSPLSDGDDAVSLGINRDASTDSGSSRAPVDDLRPPALSWSARNCASSTQSNNNDCGANGVTTAAYLVAGMSVPAGIDSEMARRVWRRLLMTATCTAPGHDRNEDDETTQIFERPSSPLTDAATLPRQPPHREDQQRRHASLEDIWCRISIHEAEIMKLRRAGRQSAINARARHQKQLDRLTEMKSLTRVSRDAGRQQLRIPKGPRDGAVTGDSNFRAPKRRKLDEPGSVIRDHYHLSNSLNNKARLISTAITSTAAISTAAISTAAISTATTSTA